MSDELRVYFSGEKLYGDDFTPDQIAAWFADEEEGYAALGAGNRDAYRYVYHALNQRHGFGQLAGRRFDKVLGLGSAYGDELFPVISNVGHITIVDPSDSFRDATTVRGVPCELVKPKPSGDLPFANGTFDLITCFGVLHHIPNVSYVMGECARCLRTGGILLLREPITSMGDWRQPRPGLTSRERGIPVKIFDELVRRSGLGVRRRAFCVFPVVRILARSLGVQAYNNARLTDVDALLSWAFSWRQRYHRTNPWQKLGPQSIFYVLEKS